MIPSCVNSGAANTSGMYGRKGVSTNGWMATGASSSPSTQIPDPQTATNQNWVL